MSEKNKQIMHRFTDEVWNKKNREIVYELLTPDFRHYMPGLKEPMVGPAAYLQLVDVFRAAFKNISMEIKEIFGEGPRVCIVWTFVGVHKGEFNGIQPIRRKIRISGVGVARIQRGKIEEVVSMFDNATFAGMLTGQVRAESPSAPFLV